MSSSFHSDRSILAFFCVYTTRSLPIAPTFHKLGFLCLGQKTLKLPTGFRERWAADQRKNTRDRRHRTGCGTPVGGRNNFDGRG